VRANEYETATMFKQTQPLQKMLRRLPLNTKQAGKEYYKGNRVGKLGTITRYGNFAPDWASIRTFVFPEKGIKDSEVRSNTSHTVGMGSD
jgi:large subunit ribosomal protein L41